MSNIINRKKTDNKLSKMKTYEETRGRGRDRVVNSNNIDGNMYCGQVCTNDLYGETTSRTAKPWPNFQGAGHQTTSDRLTTL